MGRTLACGLHYLNAEDVPLIAFPASTFLDIGGVAAGMASPLRIVRLFGRGPTEPAATAQKVKGWATQGCLVTIANEMNLALEGWTGQNSNDPALIERHAAWFLDVADRCGAVARTNLLYSPPSPGVPGWERWLLVSDAIEACHGIAAHVYGDLDLLKSTTWTYQQEAQHHGRPYYITEMNFGAGRTVDLQRWATQDMPQYLNWCVEAAPLCKAVTVFAWDWRSPDTAQGTSVSFNDTPVVTELARWVAAHPFREEPDVPEVTLGTDISNNQGVVNLAAMKAGGYEFIGIKASGDEGGGDNVFLDRFFPENWHAANANEMVRIAYHYARPSAASPSKSVGTLERAINAVGGLKQGDHIALDIEDPAVADGMSLHVWVAEWLSLAEQVFGVVPFKYSAKYYTSTHDLEHADLERYPTWWASYQDTKPPACTGWTPITIWQNGVIPGVPGVQGDCDVNQLFGTVADLRAMGYQGGDAPDVPVDPPPAVDDTTAALDGMWSFADGLEQAGQESQGQVLKDHIRRLKRSLGLE